MQEMEPSYNIISLSWVGEAYVFKFLFIFFDEYSHTLTYVKIGYFLRSIFKQLIIIKYLLKNPPTLTFLKILISKRIYLNSSSKGTMTSFNVFFH